MTVYKEKQPRVNAIKFKGGEASAREIMQHLEGNPDVLFVNWLPEVLDAEKNVLQSEEIAIRRSSQSTERASYLMVAKGQWLLEFPNGHVEAWYDADFRKSYERS